VQAATSEEEAASRALAAASHEHQELLARAQGIASSALQLVVECTQWAEREAALLAAISEQTPPELSAPPALWRQSECPTPCGLLRPLGGASAATAPGGVLGQALGPVLKSPYVQPQLVGACLQLDQQGLALLQRADTVRAPLLPPAALCLLTRCFAWRTPWPAMSSLQTRAGHCADPDKRHPLTHSRLVWPAWAPLQGVCMHPACSTDAPG
jgi:hypothetical protein